MQFLCTFSNLFFLFFKLNLILNADDSVAILETQVIDRERRHCNLRQNRNDRTGDDYGADDVEYIILISLFFLLFRSMTC